MQRLLDRTESNTEYWWEKIKKRNHLEEAVRTGG